MKSMTYKIGPLEKNDHSHIIEKKTLQSVIKLTNDYNNISDDSDSIEKDYDEPPNEEDDTPKQIRELKMENINEIIVIPGTNKNSKNIHENDGFINEENLSNSDTNSSNESGFGTVDDDIDNNSTEKINEKSKNESQVPEIIVYQPLKEQQNQGFIKENNSSSCSSSSTSQQSDNIVNKYPQSIKLPTLQGPRQIIYELNKNKNSDDIANILHDNSSINSSSSSDDHGHSRSCLHQLYNRFNKCYYSCFCIPKCTWLSIFCCCCPLLGCISMYFTNRSKKLKLNQKYAKAEKYSNYAEKLNIASLIFGVIFYAIAVFMITLVIFMYWRRNTS